MKYRIALLCLVAAVGLRYGPVEAGHGVEEYPSFYPQEIRLETLDPAAAAALLRSKKLHAYVGAAPRFGEAVPTEVRFVESLRSYLVMTFNPASAAFQDQGARCTAATRLSAALARTAPPGVVRYSYPITPYHGDYLPHFDRVQASMQRTAAVQAAREKPPDLQIRATGSLAQHLLPRPQRAAAAPWDLTLEEVPVSDLMAVFQVNGWLGPPWMKQGWFHAYQLLAPSIRDAERRRTVEALYTRLINGTYPDLAGRYDLERRLVAYLMQGCERVVVGYTVRREYYNDDYSDGIENIAADEHFGFNTPVFIRTVKLKDFLWNGWLRLGIHDTPESAWNPIAGFRDAFGRLLWAVIGEAAFVPVPYDTSWAPNRVSADLSRTPPGTEGIAVPPDALLPDAASGVFVPVGKGKISTARVIYKVRISKFHDGTLMDVADVLYPYVLAYRWSSRTGQHDPTYDAAIAAATAVMRQRLVGVKLLDIERHTKRFADLQVIEHIPHVAVYVNDAATDAEQVAALAPPWSSLPWHVLVLMEAAVQRGWAAFSQAEAARRGVAWLDPVRDTKLLERLRPLIDTFAQQGYRPRALQQLVTAAAARQRWTALRHFVAAQGHVLVTNGPYRLTSWSDHSVVCQVFRDLTYPHTLSSFLRYTYPPHALIRKVRLEQGRIRIEADVEEVQRTLRSYHTVRLPLTPETMQGMSRLHSLSRYLVLGDDGTVLRTNTATLGSDNRFTVDLTKEPLPPGQYTILAAIYVNGHTVNPAVRAVRYEVK